MVPRTGRYMVKSPQHSCSTVRSEGSYRMERGLRMHGGCDGERVEVTAEIFQAKDKRKLRNGISPVGNQST